MAGIFKAYDVRGTVPDQLNETIARRIGLAFHCVLDEEDRAHGQEIIVSRDMRSHSAGLQSALIDGLLDSGLDVIDIGLATTPMNYFAVGHLGARGGVQTTASHNPARYNGFKFSKREARPVSGDHGIPEIERHVLKNDLAPAARRGGLRHGEILEAYGERVLSFLRHPPAARRLKVVVDAGNGMGTIYRPLLERLGVEIIPLYFELDGTFPNHEANPLKLENLRDASRAVREAGADLGVAFDGDADRAAFIDERGEPLGSDLATALIGGELLSRDPGKAVVYDLRSSRAVAEYIRECGGEPVRERVGHSFIKATLRRKHGIFGGELAGHYYFRDMFHADSALLAMVEMLNLLWHKGKPMSEVVRPLERYAKSPEINFEVDDKQAIIAALEGRYGAASGGEIDFLDGITVQYPTWWFNVRPSNTEPFLRLVLEASNADELGERRRELEALLGTPVDH